MILINTLLRHAAMSVLFIGLTACGDQDETQAATADIAVSISTNPHWGTLVFDLQAITDNTVISDVVINRGNCRLPAGTTSDLSRNVSLKFGQTEVDPAGWTHKLIS
ncbi:hypothetical protein VCSRO173_2414 [Vibrio cholerae]|nr:hypothetical protein VCSRO173_2414 [Vibrio cholerae]